MSTAIRDRLLSVNVTTPGQPGIVRLPSDHLACAACGVAVPPPHAVVDSITVSQRWANTSREEGAHDLQNETLRVAQCDACAAIGERAGALLDAHPAIGARLGGVAYERVLHALLALDALGMRAPGELGGRDLALLVDRLAVASAIPWASRRAVGVCASSRWAHVGNELRASLREAAGSWMKATLERPVAYGPPAEADARGCFVCGVATVEALPSRQGDAWALREVDPGRVGGRTSAARLWLASCPPCSSSLDRHGIGVSAVQDALLRHLGARAVPAEIMTAARAWAVEGLAPTAERFGWIDLEVLRRDLRVRGVIPS